MRPYLATACMVASPFSVTKGCGVKKLSIVLLLVPAGLILVALLLLTSSGSWLPCSKRKDSKAVRILIERRQVGLLYILC